MLNNPLTYVDPSGEIPLLALVLIGAGVSVLTNGISNLIQGRPFEYGIGKAIIMGAISGAVSAGIGTIATQFTTFGGQMLFQAGAHGLSSGLMNVVSSGGDWSTFGSGFLSGAVSSLIGSSIQGMGNGFKINGKLNSFGANKPIQQAVMIASGGLSGGISSAIAGGNFWDGVRQGLITSGLNHAAHGMLKGGKPPRERQKTTKTVDNTLESVLHYFSGDGEPVELGCETKQALLNDPDYQRVLGVLKSGSAVKKSFTFRADLTQEIYHIGRTNVDYSTSCTSGTCTTQFTAFARDSFSDPIDLGLELLGGTPYSYMPYTFSISYPNPGYPVGNNIQ